MRKQWALVSLAIWLTASLSAADLASVEGADWDRESRRLTVAIPDGQPGAYVVQLLRLQLNP